MFRLEPQDLILGLATKQLGVVSKFFFDIKRTQENYVYMISGGIKVN